MSNEITNIKDKLREIRLNLTIVVVFTSDLERNIVTDDQRQMYANAIDALFQDIDELKEQMNHANTTFSN